jgi:hypothetical protein
MNCPDTLQFDSVVDGSNVIFKPLGPVYQAMFGRDGTSITEKLIIMNEPFCMFMHSDCWMRVASVLSLNTHVITKALVGT